MRYVIAFLLLVPPLLWGHPTSSAAPIEEYWKRPIPTQGIPPEGFSSLEASLNPKACGACHPIQFADWQTALHSRSMGPGVLGQLLDFKENRNEVLGCMICHAPLNEQIDEFLEGSLPEGAAFPDKEGLYLTGVSCGVCHVRGHVRFGPEPRVRKPMDRVPHGGFKASRLFGESRFCTPCHQFPEDGYSLKGKLLENTYREWLESPYPGEGKTCQSCHMPERRHTFKGIHDPGFTRKGVRVETRVGVEGGKVSGVVRVINEGAGHYFPTYVTPLVVVRVYQVDTHGNPVDGTMVEGRIGRYLPLDLSYEIFDTRIPPKGSYDLEYRQALKGDALRVEITVYPDEFYTRFYQSMLSRGIARRGKALIEEALKNSLASPYILYQKTIHLLP